MTEDYSDIINLPHPEPHNRQRMSMQARAAQFAPFAALNGHSAAIAETARTTDAEIELSEDDRVFLDQQMSILLETMGDRQEVSITYFVPDSRKAGGSYKSVCGIVQKYDDYSQMLTLEGGTRIELQYIRDIMFVDKDNRNNFEI